MHDSHDSWPSWRHTGDRDAGSLRSGRIRSAPSNYKKYICFFNTRWISIGTACVQKEKIRTYGHSLEQGWGAGKFFSGSGSWLFFQTAPAPDFFPNRLRLLVFISSGSGSWFFFQAASAPAPRSQKLPSPTGSGSWLLVKFGKIFFSPQTSKVKLLKK